MKMKIVAAAAIGYLVGSTYDAYTATKEFTPPTFDTVSGALPGALKIPSTTNVGLAIVAAAIAWKLTK